MHNAHINGASLFTKIVEVETFLHLWDQLMVPRPVLSELAANICCGALPAGRTPGGHLGFELIPGQAPPGVKVLGACQVWVAPPHSTFAVVGRQVGSSLCLPRYLR